MELLPSRQGSGLGRAIVSRIVEVSRGHRKVILYANPGREAFYRKLGFLPMSTAMAIFQDQSAALAGGLVHDS